MSRHGYTDDYSDDGDYLALGRYRGAVASAMRGKKGQAFLKELLAALDAMPVKRLITEDLILTGNVAVISDHGVSCGEEGDVCALGALGKARGLDMSKLDPEEAEDVAEAFKANDKLIREIVWYNDEAGPRETPELRWQRMRAWVDRHIHSEEPKA